MRCMIRPPRRSACVVAVALAIGTVATPVAQAQTDYPSKTVSIVVPFPAGGSADLVARWLAPALQDKLKQTFIVENRAGANGSIGSAGVARAAADGYTLLISGIGSNAINYALYSKLPYADKDFQHVSLLITGPNVIAVNPESPARTLTDLIALAKAADGKFQAAHSGNGSSNHLGMTMLAKAAGFKVVHVPYKGGAPAITDVVGGHVPVITLNQDVLLPHVQAGKLRALAVLSLERNPAYPGVPTVAEHGFPGFSAVSWFGLSAPAGTPKAVIDKLAKACAEILADPALKQKLEANGFVVVGSTPQQASAFIKAEIEKWDGVVKTNGVTVD
ncbi:MAG: tripartite tricarboxylate transporter substrate binding protein [Rhodoplanes sp.]|uniref:Bug family tripartite tricarboxylate transporter substrate binding protein n=1 Tax=Rhodoplanes sp. TaxID=1968906 RepID=UPI00180E67EB|nr:tripartite tricarboxylate transporter substrate binding protein [Rhodoplanes sp.]NVO14877.1 tripartite tricarboxylate transporter substrate binding protein [Rhodoplanes sp.]